MAQRGSCFGGAVREPRAARAHNLATPTHAPPSPGDVNCKSYIVQPGDTLDSISYSLNLYKGDVSSTNPTAPTPLTPGSSVKLPYWCVRTQRGGPCMLVNGLMR